MLVPAMTLEDIRREIQKDFPILHRKSSYVLHKLERMFDKSTIEKGVVRFFEYRSKYKNTWIYKINLSKGKNDLFFLAYYYGNKGLTAVCPLSNDILLYSTGHFFNRYNERRKLNLVMPHDIMRTFMNDNKEFKFQPMDEVSPGIYTMFGALDSGAALGMFNKNLNLYKLNTFISHDMMRDDQREMEALMRLRLNKYQGDAGKLD